MSGLAEMLRNRRTGASSSQGNPTPAPHWGDHLREREVADEQIRQNRVARLSALLPQGYAQPRGQEELAPALRAEDVRYATAGGRVYVACQEAKKARTLFPKQSGLIQPIHDELDRHRQLCELRIARMEQGGMLECEEQFERAVLIGKLTQQISITKQACFGLRFAIALLSTNHDCVHAPFPGDNAWTVE